MELFGAVFNSFYFLIIATKSSVLDVAGVLDPTLITVIFGLHNWILINLKLVLASYRNRWLSLKRGGGIMVFVREDIPWWWHYGF